MPPAAAPSPCRSPANALTVHFGEIIGNYGKGQVVQSGGTNSDNALILGGNSGSSGTYTLSGGASLSSGDQVIGFNGTGLFNQTGGNNTVNNYLILGSNSTGVGTYNLSGGQLQADNEILATWHRHLQPKRGQQQYSR